MPITAIEITKAEYDKIAGYLKAHEGDIRADINDYGDLLELYEIFFYRKPGNAIAEALTKEVIKR